MFGIGMYRIRFIACVIHIQFNLTSTQQQNNMK